MARFDEVYLETDRLILRPLTTTDIDALFTIYSDPEVMRYWSTSPWSSRKSAEESIQKDLQSLKEGTYLRLGLEIQKENELIGTCSIFDINEQCQRAEIGYLLYKKYWGKGLMKEALVTLINFAFQEMSLRRLEADIDPRNRASAAILSRLGFQKEGHLRERWIINEEILDSDIYGLLRQEWCFDNK